MNQKSLTEKLIAQGVLKTPEIITAFRKIDRKNFVLPEFKAESYDDCPLPIGYEQTISQPWTVAFMLELLEPKNGERILDIGSGSGWTTALLASIVGEQGVVFGVERIPELVAYGAKNLDTYKFAHSKILMAGPIFGLPKEAPFDKILVSAAADTMPEDLVLQLKLGGTLVIPIQNQIWKIIKRADKKLNIEKFDGFAFVPLISEKQEKYRLP